MTDRYYYAAGKKVPLELDPDHVAVPADRAKGTRLPGGMVLAKKSDVADAEALIEQGVAQRAYRSGATTAIAMPEVRIELDRAEDGERVRAALKESPIASEIVDATDERIVLRPKSGKAEDALELANFVHERATPAAAAARMVQVRKAGS